MREKELFERVEKGLSEVAWILSRIPRITGTELRGQYTVPETHGYAETSHPEQRSETSAGEVEPRSLSDLG
jgi:hypothetical protein